MAEGRRQQTRILIIHSDPDSGVVLRRLLTSVKHAFADRDCRISVMMSGRRALKKVEQEEFDLIITDLTSAAQPGIQKKGARSQGESVAMVREIEGLELVTKLRERARAPIIVSFKAVSSELRSAFKNGATYYLPLPYEPQSLAQVVGKALVRGGRRRHRTLLPAEREVFEIELPTDTRFVESLSDYLVERTVAYGLINPKRSNLFVALDEALTNAIKHGNRNEIARRVRLKAEFSHREARFTITDEGEGFAQESVPDPLKSVNLLKESGRGLMLIRHIMDEVHFNECGNAITMIKHLENPESSTESEARSASRSAQNRATDRRIGTARGERKPKLVP